MNINKQDVRIFFRYVLPSIFSFALSGIYSIVDGYFIGNRLGDAGLSAVTIVYPIVAFIQAVGLDWVWAAQSIFPSSVQEDKTKKQTG